jgi:hypothetical protein
LFLRESDDSKAKEEIDLVGADEVEVVHEDVIGRPSDYLVSIDMHSGDKIVLAVATPDAQAQLIEGSSPVFTMFPFPVPYFAVTFYRNQHENQGLEAFLECSPRE